MSVYKLTIGCKISGFLCGDNLKIVKRNLKFTFRNTGLMVYFR